MEVTSVTIGAPNPEHLDIAVTDLDEAVARVGGGRRVAGRGGDSPAYEITKTDEALSVTADDKHVDEPRQHSSQR